MLLDAIFFDVDDTLFSTSEFARRARRASVEAMVEVGLQMAPDQLEAELKEVVAEFSSNYDHHFDQLLRRIPRRFYKGVNHAVLVAAGIQAYHETKEQHLRPYADAVALLRDLAGLPDPGVVRGVITSGLSVKQAEKLLRLGIYRYLTPTAIYISDQIGINKPNVKLYRRACSDLNLKPARCVYVGDRMTRDVDPANALGLVTVHITRGGRHADEVGETEPTHRVSDFEQLRAVLRERYELPLPESAEAGEGPARAREAQAAERTRLGTPETARAGGRDEDDDDDDDDHEDHDRASAPAQGAEAASA
ncbi:MAG: HAD-IA family hydrolase [Planctomycetota bacterium]